MDVRKKRNKFNVDEELDTPFDATHLKRSFKYIKRYGKSLLFALGLSVVSTILSLVTPQFSGMVVDEYIPAEIFVGYLSCRHVCGDCGADYPD